MRNLFRIALTPIAFILKWVGTVGLRLTLRRIEDTRLFGIPVASIARDHGHEIDRMRVALKLIRNHDPKRLDQMRKDFDVILIGPLQGRKGKLYHNPVVCQVDLEYARTASVREIALAVVHEAEHARRVDSIRYHETEGRLAEERRCLEAELAFATRLPSSHTLTKAIRDRFSLLEQHYSDAAVHDSEMAILRGQGVPEWFLRLTEREHSPKTPGSTGAA
jgi:hypothetical protein